MSVITMNELGIEEWAAAHEETAEESYTGRHPLPDGFHVCSMGSKTHSEEVYAEEVDATELALRDMVSGHVEQPRLNSRDRRAAARSLQRRAAQAIADRYADEASSLGRDERIALANAYRDRIRAAGQGDLLEVSNLRNVLNADVAEVVEEEIFARVVQVLREHPAKPKRRRGRRGGRNRNRAKRSGEVTTTTTTTEAPAAKANARKKGKANSNRRGNPKAKYRPAPRNPRTS